MDIVGLSPEVLAGLAVLVMVIMQILKYFGLVVDEDSGTAIQRIVVGVLATVAIVALNYTQLLGVDYANLGELLTAATTLFAAATAAYHLLWDTISAGITKLKSAFAG